MEDVKKVFNADNSLVNVYPRETGSNPNVIFRGFADEERITFDDTKRTVRLEGRDFTALLIDKKYNRSAISLEKRIDEVLSGILADNEETAQIKLVNQVQGDLPILSSFWGEKDALSGKRNSKKDETYWDIIQDIVRRAGLIAYIELSNLVLSTPRNLYDKNRAVKFVYGKNLSNLEFSRKIGRRRGFNLIVRSLNLNTKEVLEAKIPLQATAEWSEATGIANTEVKLKKVKADGTAEVAEKEEVAPYMSFLVADVTSEDQLIKVGEGLYEEIGRQEIEGSLTTAEMSSADGLLKEFNLLHLRNGTPLQIYMNQGDLSALSAFYKADGSIKEFDKSNTSSVKQRQQIEANVAQYLVRRGWASKTATQFARSYGIYGDLFYTKAVEFSLSNDQGFRCKIDFVNFIQTKSDQK